MPPGSDDLRSRLIQAGVDLLARRGLAAVSIREVARLAGVSHGAPRRHFPTHLSLLSAIAREGFADLTASITEVLDGSPRGPRAQVTGMARAYVEFGRANPGMFELMFRRDLLESNYLGLRERALPLFRLLADLVLGVRPDLGDGAPIVAGALWANLHGIVQLSTWRSLAMATGVDELDPLLTAAFDAHLGPVTE